MESLSKPFNLPQTIIFRLFGYFVVQMWNIIAPSSSNVRMDQNPSLETVSMIISVTVLMALMNLVCASINHILISYNKCHIPHWYFPFISFWFYYYFILCKLFDSFLLGLWWICLQIYDDWIMVLKLSSRLNLYLVNIASRFVLGWIFICLDCLVLVFIVICSTLSWIHYRLFLYL